MPSFAQNFALGDIVYGLSKARAPYIATLSPALRKNCTDQGAYVNCDHFNNRTWLKKAMSSSPTGSSEAVQANLDWNLGKLPDSGLPLNAAQRSELQGYYDGLLADPKNTPTSAVGMSQRSLTKKGNRDLADIQIRRACKFGIEYILQRGNTVHFVLDLPVRDDQGFDQEQLSGNFMQSKDIVDKKAFGGYVPITTSELRTCYRNWAAWGPTGQLKFYKNLTETQAPWVEDPATWQQYHEYRMLKQFKAKHPMSWRVRKKPF